MADSPTLPDTVREFLDRPYYAAIATTDDDGSPRQAVAWFRLETDGRILVNSRDGRRWPANLRRDPRTALAVIDPADGNSWIGLTATVDEVVEGDDARDDICELADRYNPDGPDPDEIERFRREPRVSFLLRVVGFHDHLDG
jgi:PPOX class probable F420-dependent enzyme